MCVKINELSVILGLQVDRTPNREILASDFVDDSSFLPLSRQLLCVDDSLAGLFFYLISLP